MALPTEDLDWVNYLSIRHDAERPELEMLDRYYEGTQPLTYMHPEILRELGDRLQPVILAWPQLVVDSVEERLDVEGFRLPGKDGGEKNLWRVWQANEMDEQSALGHVDALVMRRSFVSVGTNEDDADTPLMTMESPLEVYADIDPRTRRVRAALRRVHEFDPIAQTDFRYATLYLPERTIWYEFASTGGKWKEVHQDEHKLGEVPLVPLVNRARLSNIRPGMRERSRSRIGASELQPIIPLSDAANKIATDMMVAAEFVALPLRGLWGVSPEDLVDESGNKLTALQAMLGRLLTMANPEGKQFEFAGADLTGFHKTIDELARMVAALGALPPNYLGLAADDAASADAIRSREARLVKRAERKQRSWGGSYERAARLVNRLQTGDWDPQYLQLETVWRDAATPTIGMKADAAMKLYSTSPVPIVPLRQTREDLGYTDTQIARMEKDDEAADRRAREAARDLTLEQMNRDVTAQEPPEPQPRES